MKKLKKKTLMHDLHIRVPTSLWTALQRRAVTKSTNATEIVITACKSHLQKG